MSKFGFDPADYRDNATKQVARVIDTAMRESGALDRPLDYALWYAGLGWYVLPVRADKKPVSGYGLTRATNDPRKIEQIWAENPDAGVAVACAQSGLVVLDIDPRNGGYDTLKRLEAEHGPLKSSTVTLTQGGGEHRYFQAEPGVTYPASLGPGVDVKHNGYVLAEPSRGELGFYRWGHDGCNPTKGSLPGRAPSLLRESSTAQGSGSTEQLIRPGSIAEPPSVYAELKAALNAIPPDTPYDEGWFRVMQGMTRLGDERAAYDMTREWSLRSSNPRHTAEEFDRKWRACSQELYAVTHKSIFHMADERDRSWRNHTPALEHKPGGRDDYVLNPISLEELRDARLNPRIILPFMLYADVRTRISAGGTGKTTLALYEAITLALGRELWGRKPEAPVKTAIVTREDTREILVARAREIMLTLELDREGVEQVLSNLIIVDLSHVGFRVSRVVDDVVQPHAEALDWLVKLLKAFAPDWLIMDPLVSFGVGEQRVNDAEQGLIEAMRILRAEFNCCVEGIHHSGKANAREKALDQYAGRGGSAMADGSRMVCVMQPLTPQEWADATGTWLEEAESGIVMAMPKMSYCRAQDPIYVKRHGYTFTQVTPLAQPSATDVERETENAVYLAIKDAWLKNEPLSLQDLKNDYKTIFYGNLKRDPVLEAVGRLKRDGKVLQHSTTGGRGAKAVLEPVVFDPETASKFAVPYEPKPGGPN